MSKLKGLGRGLSALIPGAEEPTLSEVITLPTDRIQPNPYQPRKNFSPSELKELADSITQHGILQPLLVIYRENNYILLAGERRLRAAIMAGLTHVPVRVVEVNDNSQFLILSLIENLQREDLNPLELAEGYRQLITQFTLTQEEVAKLVGKERSTIANTLRLLDLPDKIKSDLAQGYLTPGHCRAILSIPDLPNQLKLHQLIIKDSLTVRQAEAYAKKLTAAKRKNIVIDKTVNNQLHFYQEMLTRHLGTQVKVNFKGRKGMIVISFSTQEELERICEQLLIGVTDISPTSEVLKKKF
ncbi:MAG: ParB/RepB/Spo0J family partition protein [bacterium]